MKYDIFSNGEKINSIIADEGFCKQYCKENGYTYTLIPDVEKNPNIPTTPEDQLRADIDYIAVMTGVEL